MNLIKKASTKIQPPQSENDNEGIQTNLDFEEIYRYSEPSSQMYVSCCDFSRLEVLRYEQSSLQC